VTALGRREDPSIDKRSLRGRVGPSALGLTAAALTAWAAFHAGGFFPDTVGLMAVALSVAATLRITLAPRPFAGVGAHALVVLAFGSLLLTWTLLSSGWSSAPARALLEGNRTLLYLLAFAFAASFARDRTSLAVLLRWVLAALVAVALAALASRLFGDVIHVTAGRQPSRLAFPLTYWNAMAVLCAIGVTLALHVGSGGQEPPVARALATASIPVLAVAGYFPFSRGGIGVAAIGIVLYIVLAHPRRLAATLVCAVPPTVVALVVAYRSDALATDTYFAGDGPAQGHVLALVLVAAAAAAALLRMLLLVPERRLDGMRWAPGRRRIALTALAVAAVVVLGAGFAAVGGTGEVRAQYHAFVRGNVVDEGTDVRSRLTAIGNNGRLDFWRVDAQAFASQRLHGTGAGTYENEWYQRRRSPNQVVDGHSLYLETLAELGVVGLVLLAGALLAMLVAVARGLRGEQRHAHAAVLAAGVALLVHAGIDWDWEMPALFCWLFVAAGCAAARPSRPGTETAGAGGGPGRRTRVLAGLAALLLAITPALAFASEQGLRRAQVAFGRGDCATAIDAALDSAASLDSRPDPFELIGYCDLRSGQARLGIAAMQAARVRDPGSWRYAYGLAVARAYAGEDPRAALAQARRLNPLGPEVLQFARSVRRSKTPAKLHRAALKARLPF
jgi:hypothetical protein